MTIVDVPRPVTGGVDTHLDLNVAAALDPVGGLLAVAEFPATSGGHRRLLGWLAGFGPVARVGVEGTGSYGAGLARHLRAAGVEVVEVDRPNRQARRRAGKSDPLDAIEAARAALSGRACGVAKTRDGNVEAIRALVVAKRSAPSAKIKSLNQIRHLSYTVRTSSGSASRASPGSSWPRGRRRCALLSGKARTRSWWPPRLRCGSWAGGCWRWMRKRRASTPCCPSWSPRPPPSC